MGYTDTRLILRARYTIKTLQLGEPEGRCSCFVTIALMQVGGVNVKSIKTEQYCSWHFVQR